MISEKNVFSREGSVLERDVYVLSETNDRRRVNGNARRVEHVTIVLLDTRNAFENHYYSAPFGTYVDGFVRRIED